MATGSRYRSLTAKENLRIIEENNGNHAAGRMYDVSGSCICGWCKNKMWLEETNNNRLAFRGQKVRHPELEKTLCDYVDDKRQYGCAITSEMCQMKALAVSKELGIAGFKATLHLSQVVASEWVPIWLVAGIGAAWQWPSRHNLKMAITAKTSS